MTIHRPYARTGMSGVRLLTATLLTAALCLPATAADKNKKVDKRPFSAEERTAISLHIEQEQREQALYAQYHEGSAGKKQGKNNAKALPPGLQKKSSSRLPPGWERKLQRGQVLSPDLYALAEPLPPQLVAQLPIGPVGTLTVRVEGKLIRLLEATHEIIDILDL